MSEWILTIEQQPPFNEKLLCTVIGDKTQTPPPRRTAICFLKSIKADGLYFEEWDDYHESYFEVDVIAWQLYPEPYDGEIKTPA